MRLRSIRYLGWLKLVLFTNLAIPLLALPFVMIASVAITGGINVQWADAYTLGMLTIENNAASAFGKALTLAIVFALNTLLVALALKLVARWTPLGHIRV